MASAIGVSADRSRTVAFSRVVPTGSQGSFEVGSVAVPGFAAHVCQSGSHHVP